MAYIPENPLEREHFQHMRDLVGDRKFNSMIDVGCGTGFLASFFRDCCKEILAVDGITENIENAKILYPEIEFKVINLEKEILVWERDLVVFSDVIYYLTQKTQIAVMKNIYHILSDDGYLLTSRHLGGGNAELNDYLSLFEPIKSEWVGLGENPQKWYITLWRKRKSDIRSREEILSELTRLLFKEEINFTTLGILFYAYNIPNRDILSSMVEEYMKNNSNFNSTYYLVLTWLLKLENEECWNDFQDTYHASVEGATNPDFRMEKILEWVGKGKKILDVGVHNGVHTNALVDGNDVVGIDLPQVINKFKDRYKFKYKVCDIYTEMDFFEDTSFDIVTAGEIVEHLKKPEILIEQAYRILKPNGMLIVSCPYKSLGPHDPLHCNKVDEEWLVGIFKDKFIIEEIAEEFKAKGCILLRARCQKK